jgi:hypothetical protein
MAGSRGSKRRKLVVYAIDLECHHLRKNLGELDIKKAHIP